MEADQPAMLPTQSAEHDSTFVFKSVIYGLLVAKARLACGSCFRRPRKSSLLQEVDACSWQADPSPRPVAELG